MRRIDNENATLECRRTPWDERVFGFPCAEITHFEAMHFDSGAEIFVQFEAWAQNQQVKFAYGRFESTHLVKQVVQHSGFYFAEASYRIRHHKLQSSDTYDCLIRPGLALEPATQNDYEVLRTILATDFDYGRIHEDPWIDSKKASLRYYNWLADLLATRHEVYSYRLRDEVIGLHIQRCESDNVDLVLTGVKRSHALLGVSLWAEVMRLNRRNGKRQAHTVISAANISIVNLYRRFEFQIEKLLLGYHKRWP